MGLEDHVYNVVVYETCVYIRIELTTGCNFNNCIYTVADLLN